MERTDEKKRSAPVLSFKIEEGFLPDPSSMIQAPKNIDWLPDCSSPMNTTEDKITEDKITLITSYHPYQQDHSASKMKRRRNIDGQVQFSDENGFVTCCGTSHRSLAGTDTTRHTSSTIELPILLDSASLIKGMAMRLSGVFLRPIESHALSSQNEIREELESFISDFFRLCKFSVESILLGFIYLTRLQNMSIASLTVTGDNCKFLLVGAFVIAQKFWDDQPLMNKCIPMAWHHITGNKTYTLHDINALELEMLISMHWETRVSHEHYSACYWDLVLQSKLPNRATT